MFSLLTTSFVIRVHSSWEEGERIERKSERHEAGRGGSYLQAQHLGGKGRKITNSRPTWARARCYVNALLPTRKPTWWWCTGVMPAPGV